MIEPALVLDALPAHLPAHIVRQRWSGAQDRPIADVAVRWHEVVREGDPLLLWLLVEARYEDGGRDDFQLLLGARSAESPPDFLHGKDREIVAILGPDAPGVVVYDGLVDPELTVDLLRLTDPTVETVTRRPIVLEHSNSSIVFDEQRILKVFRKVHAGSNPDVEITRRLAEHGFEHVVPPLAELRREDRDLAVLREYLVGATEGWDLARGSVRDVLASGLPPEESGADFAHDAERLGEVLAHLHLALAEVYGAEPGDAARWTADMAANLDRALRAEVDADLPPAQRIPADAVRAHLTTTAALADPGQAIHIHGDLHLAQVIQTDAGWKVLDFEGEPAREREERHTTSSPLRDVAGMLRSLHYVAAVGLEEWGDAGPELAELVAAWERRNRDAFLAGYHSVAGLDALLPADRADRLALQTAFELDKAVYEVLYELGHRPELVTIPLAGIRRLLDAEAAP